jgi:hypothetical protein
MNNVIHQKNRLTKNQPQKLCPLLLAILAGSNARKTHATAININQIKLNVAPRNVMANIVSSFPINDIFIMTSKIGFIRESRHLKGVSTDLTPAIRCVWLPLTDELHNYSANDLATVVLKPLAYEPNGMP